MNIRKYKVCIGCDMRYWKTILVWVFNVKSQNMMIKIVTKMI
jgi:hypothetical protein